MTDEKPTADDNATIRSILERALGRTPDPARSTVQLARDLATITNLLAVPAGAQFRDLAEIAGAEEATVRTIPEDERVGPADLEVVVDRHMSPVLFAALVVQHVPLELMERMDGPECVRIELYGNKGGSADAYEVRFDYAPDDGIPAEEASVVTAPEPMREPSHLLGCVQRFLKTWGDSDAFDSSRMTEDMGDALANLEDAAKQRAGDTRESKARKALEAAVGSSDPNRTTHQLAGDAAALIGALRRGRSGVLHVYEIGPDTYIAYDEEDAWAQLEENTGLRRTDDDYKDEEAVEVTADTTLRVRPEEDSPEVVVLTAREWCAREGRGFLCSTEC